MVKEKCLNWEKIDRSISYLMRNKQINLAIELGEFRDEVLILIKALTKGDKL